MTVTLHLNVFAVLAVVLGPFSVAADAPVTDITYGYASTVVSQDIETDHIWLQIPTYKDLISNAVYAATQFTFEQGNPTGGGYMGSQVSLGFLKETTAFIFSVWDADPNHQATSLSPGCSRFDNEGSGSKCLVYLPIQQNVIYTMSVRMAQSTASGQTWMGTVSSEGQSYNIGSHFLPNMPNSQGYGSITPVGTGGFYEYWKGGSCDQAAPSQVGMIGPYLNQRTVRPTQAYPNFRLCDHSDASAVIPGCMPGPNILLRGGGGVSRTAQPHANIWPQANATGEEELVV